MILRYRPRAFAGDYAGAIGGVALCAVLAWLLRPPWPALAGLLGAALLFMALAFQARRRARQRLAMTDAWIELRPPRVRIPWEALSGLRLSYFSLRRDGRGGWMELRLQAGEARIRADSRLEGFEQVVARAHAAARAAGLDLDAPTRDNLAALGLEEPARRAHGDRSRIG